MKDMNITLNKLNAKYDSVINGRTDVKNRLDELIKENEEYKSLRRQELIANIKDEFDSKPQEEKVVDISLLIAGGGALAYFIGNRLFKINGNLINSLVVGVPMVLGLTSSIVSPKIVRRNAQKTNLEKYNDLDKVIKENKEVIELLKENLRAYDEIIKDINTKRTYIENSLSIYNVSKMNNNNTKVKKLAK